MKTVVRTRLSQNQRLSRFLNRACSQPRFSDVYYTANGQNRQRIIAHTHPYVVSVQFGESHSVN